MMRRLGVFLFAAAALAGASTPAAADITAEYVGETERERTVIEIADDGDLRITDGPDDADGYVLIVDGKAFLVVAGPGGPQVTAAEVEGHRFRQGLESGEISISRLDGDDQPEFMRFVAGEAIELAGYRGTEYVAERGSHRPVGVADDLALAPLGQAYLRYEHAIEQMSPEAGSVPDNLGELLAQRGIIRFWGRDLRRVSFEPIDPSRFALPADPLTLAEVLQAEADEPPVRDEGEAGYEPPIERALYFEQALYTLTTEGKLSRWAEGASEGVDLDTPDPVAALCTMGGKLVMVTGDRDGRGTVRLWSGTPEDWALEESFRQSRQDPFLALDCSGSEPLLLTAKALRLPRSNRKIAIDPERLAPGGYLTTLQHGGFLYVGANAGEWGGGLRRFALADGAGETVDASDPQDLCGGTLNMSCDPVTGLAVDPSRPECILASSGLVHFFPHGQVVRVCNGTITLAYRKPYTLDPDWEANPPAEESFSSVPFYSMAAGEDATWIVASDGLYRFGVEQRPTFTPFTRERRWPASGVDWSDPRFVLVVTEINRRFSVSGGSLLLVPR